MKLAIGILFIIVVVGAVAICGTTPAAPVNNEPTQQRNFKYEWR